LWFFKDDNAADKAFLDEYNGVAKELKGMMKVTAINCNEAGAFCKKNDVTETPSVMIYPPNPMPAFKFTGKLEKKPLVSKVTKMLSDFSLVLTKDNIDTFLTSDPSKPKVILFSNKEKAPMMWKALSSDSVFRRTIKFGFCKESEADIVGRFKVKNFPSVLQVSGTKAQEKEFYKGELKFLDIKEWINLRSESGTGDKVGTAAQQDAPEEAKPWLVQEIPELTSKSHQDICFKGEGLCVIYLKDGQISSGETDWLSALSKKFTSQLSDRGAKMKFMWMDLNLETKYKEMFDVAMLPSAVVFNPHKRLRFTKMDHGEDNEKTASEQTVTDLVEKVLGGDARFTMVKGQKLPGWAKREEAAKKQEL